MKKKGDIWISAVLYLGLGVLALTLILTAGMPLVNKLQDKNVIAQTKTLIFTFDENVRGVTNEGPGSKRFLSPFEVSRGDFYVENNRVRWTMKTPVKLMEQDITIREGSLILAENETIIVDEYLMNIYADYDNIAVLNLVSEYDNPFQGTFSVAIKNTGTFDPVSDLPIVDIEIK
ncbi:MAG: hypothetical protein V1914_04080 [archaeon]